MITVTRRFDAVRAVAFDLDNTLWDVDPVIVRAELRLMTWLREHCPRMADALTVETMRAARQQLAREEPHRAHDLTYLRLATLERHAREHGYDESIAQEAFEVFFAARHELELFGDVRPALQRLRPRFALATLTNGNADLERLGLAGLFSVSLTARQIGAAKPDPRCFARLSEELGLPPGAILYAGDDPVADVDAARAAGMPTAWINRRGIGWPATLARADVTVTHCLELAEMLTP